MLRLSIQLEENILIDGKRIKVRFYTLDDWKEFIPVAIPQYDPPLKGPDLFTLDNVAFLPPAVGAPGGTWQMLWSVKKQPAGETVKLADWNMFIAWDRNGDGTIALDEGEARRFDSSWLKSLSLASHCPEPGSWAMLILGFGLVGGAVRRAGPPAVATAG